MVGRGGKEGGGENAALEVSSGKQNKQPTDDSRREFWLQNTGLERDVDLNPTHKP